MSIKLDLLEKAKKHSEFNEVIAKTELNAFEEKDLLNRLLELHNKALSCGSGNKNVLNSWLAYYLNITNVKPNGQLELKSRRAFARASWPDVDMDFCSFRRSEIIQYLIDKYGRECVGNIGTIQTLKTKAAVRRAVKVLDPDNRMVFDTYGKLNKEQSRDTFALENEILNSLPTLMKRADGTLINSVADACKEYPDFRRYMEVYPEVYRIASKIEGTISASSCHAGGIVLSDVPLSRLCPLHVTTDKGQTEEGKPEQVLATQFTMEDVESLGLIKFDILGISTKSTISLACKLIEVEHGVDLDINHIDLEDTHSLQLISSGLTDLCFQLENDGMKKSLKQVGVDSFADLTAVISLYRPGPKEYIPDYAKRKKGQEKVDYYHPIYKKITAKTYGILVYQEQIMQIFVELAGLTFTEGYLLIKGCAKKKPEIVQSFKNKFYDGCKKNNIPENAINRVWHDLEKSAQYSFNLSHAVSYAVESMKTAYLKTHYPTEFFCARLTVETQRRNFEDVLKYENDAVKNFGFKIFDVDINESKLEWQILGPKKLRRPMLFKGMGDKAAQDIVKHQPYDSANVLYDFTSRVGSMVNTRVIEAMKNAGLWKGISLTKLLSEVEMIKKDKKNTKGLPKIDIFA